MSKKRNVVVCDDGHGSVSYEDVLVVLERADDTKLSAGTVDICLTAADEIRRLRRKVNRLLRKAAKQ